MCVGKLRNRPAAWGLVLLFLVVAVHLKAQTPPSPSSPQAGQPLFSSTCAGCHGLDGRGGEHAPNIATSARIQNLADADILHIIHDGIPGSGMPGFGSRFSNTQLKTIVLYLRVLQGKQNAASLTGDEQNGRALFFGKARCAECHSMENRGGFLGSDLSDYGSTHTAAEMEQAIVDPNKNLNPRQQTVVVVTRDGQQFSGIARNEDNFSLQLQTADGAFHLFNKSELARLEHQPRSLMPADYGSTLSRKELDDLIRYLAGASAAPVPPRSHDGSASE
jgi:cytochrome c oxidase cbb3-type subunit III